MTWAVGMPTVVLFDVDGTLIDSGGAGARSWAHAFDKLYGISADIGSHTEAGETDPVVARKTFEAAVGREPTEAELAPVRRIHPEALRGGADVRGLSASGRFSMGELRSAGARHVLSSLAAPFPEMSE
jgi:phosphoglycolate phosphatase-like HAD superfamily hydrolase